MTHLQHGRKPLTWHPALVYSAANMFDALIPGANMDDTPEPTDEAAAIAEAASLLVESESAPRMYDSLVAVARLAAHHPVRMDGELAPLNALVSVFARNPDGFHRLMALIDAKRAAKGRTPMVPTTEKRYDKTEYMRAFMDAKRQRENRAVEAENALRPAADRLIGNARMEFKRVQSAKWNARLQAALDAAREAHGARLPKAVQDKTRDDFWAMIDAELDDLEEYVRTEQLKPAHMRAPRPGQK